MAKYYVLNGEDKDGPYSVETISELKRSGKLQESDLLWCDGLTEWKPLSELFPSVNPSELNPLPIEPVDAVNATVRPGANNDNIDPEAMPVDVATSTPHLGELHSVSSGSASYPMVKSGPPSTTSRPLPMDDVIRCPFCGSTQFFGRRKINSTGMVLYICSIVNLVVSLLLMFAGIGLCTILLTPILSAIAFFGCQVHVNTCARCKRDF